MYSDSFTRRQHLFDIAATPTNVDSNILSYYAPNCPRFNFAQKASI